MSPNPLIVTNSRYRITFGKGQELRFTSHLDLHRAWERTIRRADLSLAYSEGYNPRPKINIGAALPLGCTSEADLVDIELKAAIEDAELIESLSQTAPPGLIISEVTAVERGSPKLQKLITSSEYIVPVENQEKETLPAKIQAILEADIVPRVRRGKEYDLRPLIEELGLGDTLELRMLLAARSGATGRPDEVLRTLELDPDPLVPHRLRLILRENL
ncbi:MAG: TIGR03936 family radical SAM-associated protein [Anaerolineales bacterium]